MCTWSVAHAQTLLLKLQQRYLATLLHLNHYTMLTRTLEHVWQRQHSKDSAGALQGCGMWTLIAVQNSASRAAGEVVGHLRQAHDGEVHGALLPALEGHVAGQRGRQRHRHALAHLARLHPLLAHAPVQPAREGLPDAALQQALRAVRV